MYCCVLSSSTSSQEHTSTQQHSSNTRFERHSYACCCSVAFCSSCARSHEHEQHGQSWAPEHSAAAALSSTRATLKSSGPRTPVVAVVVPLLLEQHELEQHCVLLQCSVKRGEQIFAAKYTKVRVGFEAPGWLFGSGSPSPECLLGHVTLTIYSMCH